MTCAEVPASGQARRVGTPLRSDHRLAPVGVVVPPQDRATRSDGPRPSGRAPFGEAAALVQQEALAAAGQRQPPGRHRVAQAAAHHQPGAGLRVAADRRSGPDCQVRLSCPKESVPVRTHTTSGDARRRGDHRGESDLDLLVVVAERGPEVVRAVVDSCVEEELRSGIPLRSGDRRGAVTSIEWLRSIPAAMPSMRRKRCRKPCRW